MSKFNKGDKVRVVKGVDEGKTGVITDPWWQISQSDWPLVEFTDDDGMYHYVDEDALELAEDPYEYAIQRTIIGGPGRPTICGDTWGPRDEVNVGLLDLTTDRTAYKLVKRRKAGPVEETK